MIAGVAVAILAGGQASRMGGAPKAFLAIEGRRIVDRQLDVLRSLFDEILLVANDPPRYAELGLRTVSDEVAGQGPLAGILAAIEASRAERVVAVACDMPYLDAALLSLVADPAVLADLVVPVVDGRPEPLCARYSRTCAAAIRRRLAAGERRAASFCESDEVRVHRLDEAALRAVDPTLRGLVNCNSPADLSRL